MKMEDAIEIVRFNLLLSHSSVGVRPEAREGIDQAFQTLCDLAILGQGIESLPPDTGLDWILNDTTGVCQWQVWGYAWGSTPVLKGKGQTPKEALGAAGIGNERSE